LVLGRNFLWDPIHRTNRIHSSCNSRREGQTSEMKLIPVKFWIGFITLCSLFAIYITFNSSSIVYSHANLIDADPKQNSVLDTSPQVIILKFTETLSQNLSSIKVYDTQGKQVDNRDSKLNPSDPTSLSVTLPESSNGTYTVIWKNVSTIDGHKVRGSYFYSVGEPLSTSSFSTEESVFLYDMEPVVKSIILIGILLLFGTAFFNLVILKPISLNMSDHTKNSVWEITLVPRNMLLLIGFVVTLTGSSIQLILHVSSLYEVSTFNFFLNSLINVFFDTTWGKLAWAKLFILLTLPVSYAIYRYQQANKKNQESVGLQYLVIATGVVFFVAHSLSGHNASISSLYFQGVIINILHVIFSSIWTGSIITLTVYSYCLRKKLSSANLSDFIKLSFFKFRNIGILSIALLSITGLYVGWMQVNKPEALFTLYGISLLTKITLISLAIIIAGINTYVIIKFLKNPTSMTRIAIYLITVESILILFIIISVGFLKSLEPAKSSQTILSDQIQFEQYEQGVNLDMAIIPGSLGLNSISLNLQDLTGNPIQNAANVIIKSTYLNEDVGNTTLYAYLTDQGIYETDPLMLNLEGIWQFEILIQKSSGLDSRFAFRESIGGSNPSFGEIDIFVGRILFGLTILVVGISLLILSIASGGWQNKYGRLYLTIGITGVLIGLGISIYSRTIELNNQVTNPMIPDSISVQIGKNIYRENCVACHGLTGKGDGPLYETLRPVPEKDANNLLVHVPLHTDHELFSIIKYGKEGTSMYPHESILADEEIWHLVNYIKTLE